MKPENVGCSQGECNTCELPFLLQWPSCWAWWSQPARLSRHPPCRDFFAAALHHSSLLFPRLDCTRASSYCRNPLAANVNKWKLCSATFCPALGWRVVARPFFSLAAHPILFITYPIFLLPITFFFFSIPSFILTITFLCPLSPISFVFFLLIPGFCCLFRV